MFRVTSNIRQLKVVKSWGWECWPTFASKSCFKKTKKNSLSSHSWHLTASNRQSKRMGLLGLQVILHIKNPRFEKGKGDRFSFAWKKVTFTQHTRIMTTLHPKNHEKWRFLTPNTWVKSPKNEGNVVSHSILDCKIVVPQMDQKANKTRE